MSDREERERLERRVAQLSALVATLRKALEDVAFALRHDLVALQDEVDTQRKLAKYARRTWFEVMAWIFLAGLLVSDLGRTYCAPPAARLPRTCDVVFWTTSHGGGWPYRLLGLLLTVGLLAWLAHRAQVPEHLLPRTPAGSDLGEGEKTWYYRRRRN